MNEPSRKGEPLILLSGLCAAAGLVCVLLGLVPGLDGAARGVAALCLLVSTATASKALTSAWKLPVRQGTPSAQPRLSAWLVTVHLTTAIVGFVAIGVGLN